MGFRLFTVRKSSHSRVYVWTFCVLYSMLPVEFVSIWVDRVRWAELTDWSECLYSWLRRLIWYIIPHAFTADQRWSIAGFFSLSVTLFTVMSSTSVAFTIDWFGTTDLSIKLGWTYHSSNFDWFENGKNICTISVWKCGNKTTDSFR